MQPLANAPPAYDRRNEQDIRSRLERAINDIEAALSSLRTSVAGILVDGTHGDITVSDEGETLTIVNGAVTESKIADDAVTQDKIADGAVATSKLANAAVTYAKLQAIAAQFRLLGRNSSGSGSAEEVTLTQLLDWIGSAAQGDLLVRGATSWQRLPAGSAGYFVQSQGASADLVYALPPGTLLGIIEDQKAQNTPGGTFTAGAWQTRDLNTEVYDRLNILSLSSNEITISQAGDYEIEWSAPAREAGTHQTRLFDVTGSAAVQMGQVVRSASGAVAHSEGLARITIAGSRTFRIEHRCDNSQATNGLGLQGNFTTEVYTRVIIRKG